MNMVARSTNKLYILDKMEKQDSVLDLFSKWNYYIGFCSRFIKDKILEESRRLSFDDIEYAIVETANAPRPSIRYFSAICDRLVSNPSRKRPSAEAIKNSSRNKDFDYFQREYSEDELMDLFDNRG